LEKWVHKTPSAVAISNDSDAACFHVAIVQIFCHTMDEIFVDKHRSSIRLSTDAAQVGSAYYKTEFFSALDVINLRYV
jgi:hypothetical protein